MHIVHCFSK